MKVCHFTRMLIALLTALSNAHLLEAQVSEALETHFKRYPQEKVYVQTDKQVYSTSQTIWYKVYATVYGTPATLSKIVHVQLIDSSGKVILQDKLPLVRGNAHGDFLLPENLATNNYQLRCFTAWMLNFDESGVFHKNVYIKNLSDTVRDQPEKRYIRKTYQVHFFPEGGDLVDNITATVAFQATDQYGSPAQVYGEITDDHQTLDSFNTFHDGMGKFSFHPLSSHVYHAVVHLPDHSEKEMSLPPVKISGIGVKIVEQTPNAFTAAVVYHEAVPGQYHDILLAAYQQSGKVATYPLVLSPGINLFSFSTKDFTAGILRLSFFDDNNMPLAERIIFLHQDALHITLQKDTLSFAPKTKNAFDFQITGADWKIDKTNLSVSVTDADRVLEDNAAENIYAALLLTPELKGRIINPAYYFNGDGDSLRDALDLVMLTHGWRHFEWKQLISHESPALPYPVEDSLYIAGKIIGYHSGDKNEHLFKMIIQQADSIRFIGYISPDTTGRFMIKDYARPGVSTVFFQDQHEKNKNLHVRFYNDPMDTISASANPVEPLATWEEDTIEKSMGSVWISERTEHFLHRRGDLKPVIIRGHVSTPSELLAKKYVSPEFDQGLGHNIDLINNFYPNSLPFFDFLKGRFPGLVVSGDPDHPYFSFRNSAENEFVPVVASTNGVNDGTVTKKGDIKEAIITSEPYVFLNEVPSSIQAVRDIPLSEIALIRFIAPPASMAPFNGGAVGVLAVYLKKESGEVRSLDIAHNYDQYVFHGYSISRQFYSPDYSRKDSAFFVPDNRETLYWNPELQTGSDNNIHFSFFNSDHAKKIRIVAEGMDEQGRLIYINKMIAGH
ncbi:MAG TPA: hypothetical protein VKR53_09285 [Puia sp.]|nr:hypothetical protein [Puia sp.]